MTVSGPAMAMSLPGTTNLVPGTACDKDYWDRMGARAWLEGKDDMTAAQVLITRPQSVLDVSCFEGQLIGLQTVAKLQSFYGAKSNIYSSMLFKNYGFAPFDDNEPIIGNHSYQENTGVSDPGLVAAAAAANSNIPNNSAAYQVAIAPVVADINATQAQIDAVQIQINNTQAQIAATQAQITATQTQITTTQANINSTQSLINWTEAEILNVEGQIAADQATLAATQAQRNVVAADTSLPPAVQAAQLAALDAQIAALTSQIGNLTSYWTALNNDLATYYSDLATYNTQLTNLQTQLSTLQAQLASLQAQLAALNAQMAVLVAKMNQLKLQANAIGNTYAANIPNPVGSSYTNHPSLGYATLTSTTLDDMITDLIRKGLRKYMGNFYDPIDPRLLAPINPLISTICGDMNDIWETAKCTDFDSSTFWTLGQMSANDPRASGSIFSSCNPVNALLNGTLIANLNVQSTLMNAATGLFSSGPTGVVDPQNVYLPMLNPTPPSGAACSTAIAIPTGLIVDPGGIRGGPYPDAVCSAPSCWYDHTTGTCK